MRYRKPLDFEQHVDAITAVAGVKQAPEQLALDEQIPDQLHDLARVDVTEWARVARCTCGWKSRGMLTIDDATLEYRRHLTRTPQGTALVRTIRRVGRGSSGS